MKQLTDEFRLILRGIRYIHRLAPGNLLVKLIKNTLMAALPFLDLYFSARILDVLIAKESITKAIILALLLAVSHFAVQLGSAVMDIKNYEMFNGLYRRYNMMISAKVMGLDYEKVEDPETHKAVRHIDNAMKISNFGLIKVHSRIPLLYQHLLSLILALVFIIDVIAKPSPAGSVYAALADSPWALLILLAAIILASCTGVVGNSRISANTYTLLGVFSKLNCVYDYYLNRYLAGQKAGKDIRLYEQYRLISDELSLTNRKSRDIVDGINRTEFRWGAGNDLSAFVLTLLSYLYAGLKALAGAVSIGSVMKFSGAVAQLGQSVCGIVDALSQLHANTPYLRDFLDFMEHESRLYRGTLTVEKRDDNEYDIEFRNVSFRYPGSDTYALRHVNLTFKVGEKLAVVGMNGSGKTTFIKLLCRLYDPTEGEILLNGVDIRKYDYSEYLALFSVVFQDFRLFSFSLGQNIAASRSYDDARVVQCLEKAGLGQRFAHMQSGTDTCLYRDFDPEGVEISGGEAQKIALARALYKDAPFIILDEPTAALDPVAEYEIYERFNRIVGDKTTIYISHRLASCRFCDRIAVFDGGHIVQHGSHEALLAKTAGRYYELWQAQAQYYV
ncbi:MAG: ABC transporter ATP-binding protein [Ruminococcaceae bacterium]|nr:ABC transporter ATP-binding protein [Oscillospiraceae bacterium]